MSFQIRRDTLTPALANLARELDPKFVLEAMGMVLVSRTQGAFNDSSVRPAAWAPTKTGHSILKKHGTLYQSIRITGLTATEVRVGTDRPYASYHQFGTKAHEIKARLKKALFWNGAAHPVKKVQHPGLPARPFFPFDSSGRMTMPAQEAIRKAALGAIEVLLKRAKG